MAVARRLLREYKSILAARSKDYLVRIEPNNLMLWHVTLFGAKDTPWENGVFKLDVQIPRDYPMSPPEPVFVGVIPFHPNVYQNGKICLNFLKNDWSEAFGIESLMTAIITLLVAPNPDSPANNTAAKLFTEHQSEYERHVASCVRRTLETN